MGQFLPDRLFWAREEARTRAASEAGGAARAPMSAAATDDAAARRRARARRLRGLYAVTPDLADTARSRRARRRRDRRRRRRDPVSQQDARRRRCAATQAQALGAACAGARRAVHRQRRRRARRATSTPTACTSARTTAASRPRARMRRPGRDRRRVVLRRSCARAKPRSRAGADYVAFGSFFRFAGEARRATRRPRAARARAALGVPVVAIGGITADNARALVAAGADAVAVITAVFAHRMSRGRRCAPRARWPTPLRRAVNLGMHDADVEPQRTSSSRARSARSRPASTRRCARSARSAARRASSTRGEGAVPVGRRRQALHRLRRLVGPGDPRPRASGGRARGAGGRARTACRSARRPRAKSRWRRRCAACVPSIEMVRLVSSGTEATMSALRLARGFTGRSKIVKFEGCYHGHGDSLLVKAGSGALTFGQPSSAGVPPAIANETIVAALQRHRRGRGGVRRRWRATSPASSSSRSPAT